MEIKAFALQRQSRFALLELAMEEEGSGASAEPKRPYLTTFNRLTQVASEGSASEERASHVCSELLL